MGLQEDHPGKALAPQVPKSSPEGSPASDSRLCPWVLSDLQPISGTATQHKSFETTTVWAIDQVLFMEGTPL